MDNSVSVAITGSGGSGAVTTGLILLNAMSQAGFYGYLSRSAGPQIRGGESAVMMRFSKQPVFNLDDRFDLLLALDWHKVERFADEIPLDSNSLILCDAAAGEIPAILLGSGARSIRLEMIKTAKTIEGGRANMLGLGLVAKWLGLSLDSLQLALQSTLAQKGEQVIRASMTCVEQGMLIAPVDMKSGVLSIPNQHSSLWNISGNEACGLGGLRGGVRFVAAYPITPASDILEWMAPKLELLGGSLMQAEDELASINMIIGASFGGVPAMTATSGPGLSLMMEGLGLAVASETPVVVINVMRGGPSTGIPTKSEQADLNLALYGFHGDAPHLVLAPLHIGDCIFTTQWSVCLAEQLQAVAIVLSDQSLGQSRLIMESPAAITMDCQRQVAESTDQTFNRYQLNDTGISAMGIPGVTGTMYTADGLEHNERGTPSSMAADHQNQMDKRLRKIIDYDFGCKWAEIKGRGDLAMITWGASSAVCFEARARLRAVGIEVVVITIRLLMPLQVDSLREAIAGCRTITVVEQNKSGQLYHYLRSESAIPEQARSFARAGPLPFKPNDIVTLIRSQADE